MKQYLGIVASYRRGGYEDAPRRMAEWPGGRLAQALDELRSRPVLVVVPEGSDAVLLADVEAAVILHTDAALAAQENANTDPGAAVARRHIEIALNLIIHLETLRAREPALHAVSPLVSVRDWLLVAGATMQSAGDLTGAEELLRRALARDPSDAQALMALAMCEEERYQREAREFATYGERRSSDYTGGRREKAWRDRAVIHAILKEAERHYRRALEIDARLDEARVRLARVEILLDNPNQAVVLIGEARTGSRDPRVLYLAHLLAGHLAEQRSAGDEAIDCYRRASALLPGAQAARVGLAQALERAGRADEARAALAPALAQPPGRHLVEDPWWIYPLGYVQHASPLLDAMRARVMLK